MQSIIINSSVPVPATPEIVFLKGGVSLWNYSIPFFTTNVPLQFAADYFKLFEDLSQSDTSEWSLEELFQREISWERVETDILSYLNNPSKPQFFNALTVALLPKDAKSLGGDFDQIVKIEDIPDEGLGSPLMIGGIQIQFYGSNENVESGAGKMRWSTQHVDAVAVDGQHRLAAIKRFLPETRSTKWETASVPVIFLIADERVGFRTPHGTLEKTRTVSALRSVFIDLNKNAKAVSPTRNILLDDLDIVSVCVRSLIGRSLGSATNPERIPLALVDWLTDRNKIDDGPFMTTVMLLYEALRRLLDVPDIQLDQDDDSVDRVLRWLREILPPANTAAEEDIMTQVRICARSQSRLALMPPHLKTLHDAFDVNWRPHFRSLFRDFTPYGNMWSYFEKKELAGARFINLYVAQEVMREKAGKDRATRLVAAAKREIEGWSLEKRYTEPMSQITAMKDDKWPFKIVFQRALLRAFSSVLRNPENFLDLPGNRTETAAAFIAAMNLLVASKLDDIYFKVKQETFWQGSGLTADDTIEFTNAGAERLRTWMETFFILRTLGRKAPRYDDLPADTSTKPLKTLNRHMALVSTRVAYKGFSKLAAARGYEEDAEVVSGLMRLRYDYLRSIAIK